MEPLLQDNKKRYILYPLLYKDIFEWSKKQERAFWIAESVDLDNDDIYSLNKEEYNSLCIILSFFAFGDEIINDNIINRLLQDTTLLEAKRFYIFQIAIESVHSEMYSLLLMKYVKNDEIDKYLNALENMECVKRKYDWMLKWVNNDDISYQQRIIAQAIMEGIFFSSSFAFIFWLKSRKYNLPGLYQSNEMISGDEGLHRDFACFINNNYIKNKLDIKLIEEMVIESVDIEKHFINSVLKVDMIGMNKELMGKYIEYIADTLLVDLKCNKIYNSENPFEFMILISIDGKTNFLERNVTEYKRIKNDNIQTPRDNEYEYW